MTRNARLDQISLWTLPLSLVLLAACATNRTAGQAPDPRQEELEQARRQVQELRDQVSTLNGRLEGMELKMVSLHDELKASKTSLETISRRGQDSGVVEISAASSSTIGKGVLTSKAESDPEAGLVTDIAVETYRKAMILFESKKYPEAMLAFTNFLEQYADHPWAGAAQYHVGQSYHLQKECKLAIQEYQRVLTSYDRSSHVADSLQKLAACEEELKMPVAAAKHRQLLISLFPNSPAARDIVGASPPSVPSTVSAPTAETTAVVAPTDTESAVPPTAPAEGTSKQ
jgi:TolA-binding protein